MKSAITTIAAVVVVGALTVCLAGCNRSVVVVVFDVPSGVSAMSIDGDRVFLAGNPRQPDLCVVSFASEQAGPQETVATGVFGPPRPGNGVGGLVVQGSTAFAALSSGFLVLDVSDAASPQVLATLDQDAPRGSWRSLAVADGLAVLAQQGQPSGPRRPHAVEPHRRAGSEDASSDQCNHAAPRK